MRLAALRRFYSFLEKDELVRLNPAKLVDRQPSREPERLPLSFLEFLELLDAIEKYSPPMHRTRNAAIFAVAWHCGLRVNEIIGLDRDQVDFGNHVFLDVETKGDKQRQPQFNDVVAEALERYLGDSRRPAPAEGDTALFLSNRGRRLAVRTVQKAVHRLADKAGISRAVTPHIFRRSYATELSREGVPIEVIQTALGHADIRTTRRYIHVGVSAQRDASDKLGARHRQIVRDRQRGAKSGKQEVESGQIVS